MNAPWTSLTVFDALAPAEIARGRLLVEDIPCVLVECGYLSNAAEAHRIADPGYRQALADAIADAIKEQSAHGDAGMGPLPPPLNAPPSRPTDARE